MVHNSSITSNYPKTASKAAQKDVMHCATKIRQFHSAFCVEVICTKHAYVQDPPDLTLFNSMQDTESIPLVNLLRKN